MRRPSTGGLASHCSSQHHGPWFVDRTQSERPRRRPSSHASVSRVSPHDGCDVSPFLAHGFEPPCDVATALFRGPDGEPAPSVPVHGNATAAIWLADRYVNPVGRLREAQLAWRRQHDRLMRKKRREAIFAATANGETGVVASARPKSEASSRRTPRVEADCLIGIGGRPMSQASTQPQFTEDRPLVPPLALTAPPRLAGEAPASTAEAAGESRRPATGLSAPSRPLSKVQRVARTPNARSPEEARPRVAIMKAAEPLLLPKEGVQAPAGLLREEASGELDCGSLPPTNPPTPRQAWHTGDVQQMRSARTSKKVNIRDIDYLLDMAKKHCRSVAEVRQRQREFIALDTRQDGLLSVDEFKQLVRRKCNLPQDGPVPSQLLAPMLKRLDGNLDRYIDFEEFLIWSIETAFTEEILVPNPMERYIRHIARSNGYDLLEVERVKAFFDKYDTDNNGVIDSREFKQLLVAILNLKNPADASESMLKRLWRDVDADGSGEITFEEYVSWHFKRRELVSN